MVREGRVEAEAVANPMRMIDKRLDAHALAQSDQREHREMKWLRQHGGERWAERTRDLRHDVEGVELGGEGGEVLSVIAPREFPNASIARST